MKMTMGGAMQIGTLQHKEIAALRRIVTDIEEAAGRESREPFARLRNRLDGWTARVAVIASISGNTCCWSVSANHWLIMLS